MDTAGGKSHLNLMHLTLVVSTITNLTVHGTTIPNHSINQPQRGEPEKEKASPDPVNAKGNTSGPDKKSEAGPKQVSHDIETPEYSTIESPEYSGIESPKRVDLDTTPIPGKLYDFDLELHPYGILDYEPWDEDEATRGESLLDESDSKVNFLCLADDTILTKVIYNLLLLHIIIDRIRLRKGNSEEVDKKHRASTNELEVKTYTENYQEKFKNKKSKTKHTQNTVIFPSPLFINISIYYFH